MGKGEGTTIPDRIGTVFCSISHRVLLYESSSIVLNKVIPAMKSRGQQWSQEKGYFVIQNIGNNLFDTVPGQWAIYLCKEKKERNATTTW